MRIGVLGPIEVRTDDGQIVDFGRPKVRSLLALLAAETGKTVSADRLIDGLWGTEPPATAQKTLQGYIFQLRTVVPDLIATERGGYRLNLDRSQIDAFRFEELIRKARSVSGPEAIGLFEEALGLWRDVPFVDLDHDEPIRPLRARLEEVRLEAVEGRIEALIAAGQHRQVVSELSDLVMEHPLRERLWEQYMTALYVTGRQADALRAYQDARRLLVAELGIEPGANLRLLEEKILAQDPALLPATSSEPSRHLYPLAPPVPAATTARDERKMITALFADVAGSTELSGRLEPEEMKLVFGEALSRFARVAEELGGTVTTLAGDGFLALFGAPVTHEDDAERAVRAALGILEVAISYANEVRTSFGVEGFAVRVGVDSGPAAVGMVQAGHKSDYSGYGVPVNTASRLQAAARPGSLLVSASTRRLADHAFVWGEAAHLDLKGLPGTVTAWEVVKAAPPGEARRIRRLRAPLVGRDDDLASARELLEAVRRGSGGVLLISGEPGIGKSRLISELKSELDSWADVAPIWIEGHGLSYGEALPYWPFREMIRVWLEVTPSDPDLRVRVALHRKLDQLLGAEAESHYPYLGYLLGIELEPEASDRLRLSPESLQYRTFEVVAAILRAISQQGPLVVVIDDLHWIDPTSLLLIDHLLPLIDEEALLLIIAQRVERDHASWTVREEILRRYPHRSREVRLEGLGASDEQRLLDELVRGADLPAELESRLLAAAEGNPFYLEELVGGLIDGGSLVPGPEGWRLDHETAVELPTTVEAVVLARIDRLDQDSHETLTAASVLGRTFGLPLLHEVVGEQATVLDSLRTLQRLDFLHEVRRWPQAEYRFKHALIQEAAYRTIPSERRVSVHRTAAAWLAEHAEREAAGLLARHWLAAGDEERAIPLLLRAGDQARQEHALDEAIEHYRSLLGLLEKRGERRTMALTLFKLGQALHSALRFAEASATFERAFTNWDVPSAVPKATATLRHAGSQPPTQPDPPRSYNLQDMQLQMALFDRLVERLAEDTIVPSLAERWEVSEDGMRYLFHLRPGLLWSDGQPLTAADVEYGLKRNLDPSRPGISVAIYFALEGAQGYALGHHQDADRIGVKALDDRTVEFRLAAPAPFFLSVVNRPDGGPQPQHAIERYGDSWIDLENQVVSGPFRRTEVSPTLTVLERRPDYQGWRSGNVKRVELHTEPPMMVGDNYRQGKRELVFAGASFGTEKYGEIPTGEMRMEPTAWLMYLMPRYTDGPASDLRYRKALAHTIDRRRLQAKAPTNFLPATGGIVPPALPGHTPDIALRHDPELARRLLAASGLSSEVLRLGLQTGTALSELGYEVAAMWGETLGIPIEILEWQPGDEEGFVRSLKGSHVTVAIWFPGYPDPEYFLRLLLHSDAADNRGNFNHPPFDDLIERARRERDGRKRLRLFHEADRMAVTEQVAIIPLAYARNVTIAKPWVSGWWEFGKSWSSFADLTVDEASRNAAGIP